MVITLGAGVEWEMRFSRTPGTIDATMQGPDGVDHPVSVEGPDTDGMYRAEFVPDLAGRWVLTVKSTGSAVGAAESVVDVKSRRKVG